MNKCMNTMGSVALLPILSSNSAEGYFLLRGPLMMMTKPVCFIYMTSLLFYDSHASLTNDAVSAFYLFCFMNCQSCPHLQNNLSDLLFLPLCADSMGKGWRGCGKKDVSETLLSNPEVFTLQMVIHTNFLVSC